MWSSEHTASWHARHTIGPQLGGQPGSAINSMRGEVEEAPRVGRWQRTQAAAARGRMGSVSSTTSLGATRWTCGRHSG
jgi:hypothetical protein